MKQHIVHVTSLWINPVLQQRLSKYQQRYLDHGMDALVGKKGGQMTYQNVPVGKTVSTRFLNEKKWDDSEKTPTNFGLNTCDRFLIHVSMALVPSFLVLMVVWRWSQRNGSKIALVQDQFPKKLSGRKREKERINERLMEIRRRMMQLIQEARERIMAEKDKAMA